MSTDDFTIELILLVETAQPSSWYLVNKYSFTVGGNLHKSWPATIFTFWLVFCFALECLSFIFNFLLSSRSCDDVDSDFARESFQIISGARLYGAQILVHGDTICDFHGKWNLWNWEIDNSGLQNQFAQRFAHHTLSVPCAARKIQVFGGATCMTYYGQYFCMMLLHRILSD